MNLPRLFIHRHVLAASLSLAIVLLGALAFFRVGVDRSPDVEFPTLTITTRLPGASPETVARTVTQPLEARLNTLGGIDLLSSTSVTGQSNITITFSADKPMAEVLNDVQSRIGQAQRELPSDAETPVVAQLDPNASAIMWLTLAGQRDKLELTAMAEQVRKRLETIAGVGEVQLRGIAERGLHVTVDDHKLASLALTHADIRAAFVRNHLNTAGGRLKTPGREYQVELDFEYATPEALEHLPVAEVGARTVRLGEIATITEELKVDRGFARFNGESTVFLGIVKASGANPVDVVRRIEERIATELVASLPDDVMLTPVYDDAKPIEAIASTLQMHLVEGTLLTALVVWLFLKNVRATLIIATAIPVSLLGSIAAIYFLGYTFNSITLLALLLLIGVVVDDAIVVLENIHRVGEEKPSAPMAVVANEGASEVMFAVMAATLTLVCVFGPVLFLPGMVGKFFQSFAVIVVVGVLISWFVSMTLTPMLCSRWLARGTTERGLYAWLERAFRSMESGYRRVLDLALSWRKTVLLLALATLAPAFLILQSIDSEFSPATSEGRISVRLDVPAGHGRDALLALAERAEGLVRETTPYRGLLANFFDGSRSGSDTINMTVVLHDEDAQRQPAIIPALQAAMASVPDWRAQVSAASGGASRGGPPLQFFLQGPDHVTLQGLAEDMRVRLSAVEGMGSVRNNLTPGLPQLSVELDVAEAARLGVSAQDVAVAVSAMNGQLVMGRYTADNGERYDVVLRSDGGIAPEDVTVLEQVRVRTRTADLVPLSTVASFRPTGAVSSLQRVNQQYAVQFFINPSMAMGAAMAEVTQAAAELPAGYTVRFTGQAEEMGKAGGSLAMVFGLALVLLYLVLASQFNGYRQPFLVMLAQPLAVIGGIGALAAMGLTLNIYSVIGLVLLVGLVAKNAILLVDRTNQLVAQGMSTGDALRRACPERMRPVLMTSLTLMLAMAPAAIGLGAGSENNQPLAVAIIGGMGSSTLLTLVVVPAAYSLLQGRLGRKTETGA